MTNKIFFICLLFATPIFAEIKQTSSHIVIMQTDAEYIWGSYYFGVQNTDSTDAEYLSTLRLPRESTDFQVGEGLSNENVSIGEDGILQIRKTYPPGLTLQSIQFKVPVKKDSDNILTFVPPENIAQFYFNTPQTELLKFSAEGFEVGIPPMLQGSNYSGIRGMNIAAGQEIRVRVSGFPGGRLPFFILGACMGFVLLVASALLTLRTMKEAKLREGIL